MSQPDVTGRTDVKLLALDLGTRMMGWAHFEGGNLVSASNHSFDTDASYFGQTLVKFRLWLDERLRSGYDVVAYEEIVPRNKHHMEQHFGMVGLMAEVLYRRQTMLLGVHTKTMKKQVTGSGNAKKDEVLDAIRGMYPEVNVPDHNAADAVGVGLVAFENLKPVISAE